jgi:hypothetical protein
MELASSAMKHGARSDRPVGEHPSRQWSLAMINTNLRESLKCPIHIAIERGHVKMVDLFVRQSILCTQVREAVTNYLPYMFALFLTLSTDNEDDRQRYHEIHFYLHDKQFNLKIPINATGEYVSNLLTFTTSTQTVYHSSTHHSFVSLAFYCRMIRYAHV